MNIFSKNNNCKQLHLPLAANDNNSSLESKKKTYAVITLQKKWGFTDSTAKLYAELSGLKANDNSEV